MAVKVLTIPTFAFYHLEKDVAIPIFFYIEKIGPVIQRNLSGVKLSTCSHAILPYCLDAIFSFNNWNY